MPTYNISNKIITTPLPRLYADDKLKRKKFWEVIISGDEHHCLSGIVGGVTKKYSPVKSIGKNIGKKNETTPQQQTILEAYSKWTKKHDQGYHPYHLPHSENKDEPVESKSPSSEHHLPMLAQKYTERSKHLKEPFGISAKLDGVRCLASYEDGEVVLKSRLGKEFKWMNSIREQLEILFIKWGEHLIFDGELYSHTIPFNAISGAARSSSKLSKFDDKLEFWIFDLAVKLVRYEDREELLHRISEDVEDVSKIKFVFSEKSKHNDLEEAHGRYVSQGYEGIILRNYDGMYLFNFRSNDLQKYKHFIDEEFLVVDIDSGKGTEEGAIIFVCETEKGERFSVRPRGSISKRRWMLEGEERYLNKKLTVRYQPYATNEEGCLPRFPAGISFPEDVTKIELDLLEEVDLRDYE